MEVLKKIDSLNYNEFFMLKFLVISVDVVSLSLIIM